MRVLTSVSRRWYSSMVNGSSFAIGASLVLESPTCRRIRSRRRRGRPGLRVHSAQPGDATTALMKPTERRDGESRCRVTTAKLHCCLGRVAPRSRTGAASARGITRPERSGRGGDSGGRSERGRSSAAARPSHHDGRASTPTRRRRRRHPGGTDRGGGARPRGLPTIHGQGRQGSGGANRSPRLRRRAHPHGNGPRSRDCAEGQPPLEHARERRVLDPDRRPGVPRVAPVLHGDGRERDHHVRRHRQLLLPRRDRESDRDGGLARLGRSLHL